MGNYCSKENKSTERALILAGVLGLGLGGIVLAEGGVPAIENAIMTTVLVGGISLAGMWLWSCDFNLGKCVASGSTSTVCGAVGAAAGIEQGAADAIGDFLSGL